ncbi:unnamed protein product [Ranitomeya imitator]|uniref:MADF domain-containing protein n=1 Tax=Ranitomeya imitator TaxID=111125 RepID=A0ABN9M4T1_9NEOB|nr:unnamed protein product [Ranitomeya imitator]
MFTLVTGIVGRWRAVCVTALQRPNSDAAAIRIVVGIAAASLSVTMSFNTEEFVRELIEMYRSLPCLWQIKSAEYSNRNKKREAFAKLVALFQQHNPSEKVDESVVRKKIQGLRTVYKKELNKVVRSMKSGAATDEVYVPSLWYFDLLGFTRDQELPRTMASSMRQTLDEDPVITTDTPVGDQNRHDDQSTPTGDNLLGHEPSRVDANEGSIEDPAPSTPNTAYLPRRMKNGHKKKGHSVAIDRVGHFGQANVEPADQQYRGQLRQLCR